jgi:hypothetical protein
LRTAALLLARKAAPESGQHGIFMRKTPTYGLPIPDRFVVKPAFKCALYNLEHGRMGSYECHEIVRGHH